MENDKPAFELQFTNGTFKIYANGKIEGLELVHGHCIIINRIRETMDDQYNCGFDAGFDAGANRPFNLITEE